MVRQSAPSRGRNLSRAVECMNVERLLLPSPSVPSGNVRRPPLSRCIWPDSKTSFFIALIIAYTPAWLYRSRSNDCVSTSRRNNMAEHSGSVTYDTHQRMKQDRGGGTQAKIGTAKIQRTLYAVTLFEVSINQIRRSRQDARRVTRVADSTHPILRQ